MNDQPPIPADLTPVNSLRYPFVWVGPTGGLNILEKRGMSSPSRYTNPWPCRSSSIHYTMFRELLKIFIDYIILMRDTFVSNYFWYEYLISGALKTVIIFRLCVLYSWNSIVKCKNLKFLDAQNGCVADIFNFVPPNGSVQMKIHSSPSCEYHCPQYCNVLMILDSYFVHFVFLRPPCLCVKSKWKLPVLRDSINVTDH